MIKVFCDKCGKEITDNVNNVIEETEAKNCYGNTLMKFASASYQYCDECMENGLTCGFKVGDEVITSTGEVGRIISFCTCQLCKERGFYEPTVEVVIGNDAIHITDSDKRNGFSSFYKIGDQVFGNIDEDAVKDSIKFVKEQVYKLESELIELTSQLDVVKILKRNQQDIKKTIKRMFY